MFVECDHNDEQIVKHVCDSLGCSQEFAMNLLMQVSLSLMLTVNNPERRQKSMQKIDKMFNNSSAYMRMVATMKERFREKFDNTDKEEE